MILLEQLNDMARYNNNSKAGIVGKLGPLVLTPDAVRTRPRKRIADGWTSDQKAQRDRMKSVAGLYRKVKYPVVEYVWLKTMPSRRVAYNQTVGDLKLPFKMGAVVSKLNTSFIHVSWENNLPEGWDGCFDSLMGIFFNGDSFSLPLDFKACRKDNHAFIRFPEEYCEGYYLYLFFISRDKTKISNSFSVRL